MQCRSWTWREKPFNGGKGVCLSGRTEDSRITWLAFRMRGRGATLCFLLLFRCRSSSSFFLHFLFLESCFGNGQEERTLKAILVTVLALGRIGVWQHVAPAMDMAYMISLFSLPNTTYIEQCGETTPSETS